MQIEVLLFGIEAGTVGADRLTVALSDVQATCADLRQAVAEAAPELRPHARNWRFAVNQKFAREDQPLCQGDEVALIGLVGGG